MLTITQPVGRPIKIGHDITIVVHWTGDNSYTIGIEAPPSLKIDRNVPVSSQAPKIPKVAATR